MFKIVGIIFLIYDKKYKKTQELVKLQLNLSDKLPPNVMINTRMQCSGTIIYKQPKSPKVLNGNI